MKRMTAYFLAGLMAVSLMAGCGKEQKEDTAPTQENTEDTTGSDSLETDSQGENNQEESLSGDSENKGTISFTYVKSPLNVPSIVEKEKGTFSKNFGEKGYQVAYSDLTTGPEQTQALASGDIQFLNAVGATSVILSASNEADIKIISIYSRSPKAFKLFSKDESISSPEDLKGKKVAGPKGTILHELLTAYLASAGLTENDIEFMAMGIPDSQAALAGGSVDAALLAGPTAYNMEKDGFHVVTDGENLTDATIVTATSQKFYDENPELVKLFLESQKEVLDFMDSNYEEAVAITAKETELSEDAVKEMYEMYDFNMEITDSDIAAMEKTEQFMLDTKMIEKEVDIQSLILDVE